MTYIYIYMYIYIYVTFVRHSLFIRKKKRRSRQKKTCWYCFLNAYTQKSSIRIFGAICAWGDMIHACVRRESFIYLYIDRQIDIHIYPTYFIYLYIDRQIDIYLSVYLCINIWMYIQPTSLTHTYPHTYIYLSIYVDILINIQPTSLTHTYPHTYIYLSIYVSPFYPTPGPKHPRISF